MTSGRKLDPLRIAAVEAKTNNSSNESLFTDEKPKDNNRNNSALDRKGNSTRQSHADTWGSGPLKGDSQHSELRDSHLKPLSTIQMTVAHALVASSKPKVELDSHADMCVVGHNCLVIHDHNRPVDIYSYDLKRSQKCQDSWCHSRLSFSTEWSEVHLNDKPNYWHRWISQPSSMPHAVPFEWCANQWSSQNS